MKTIKILLIFALCSLVGCTTAAKTLLTIPQAIQISGPGIDTAEPAIAPATDGSVFLAWVEHGEAKAADVFVQKCDSEGRPAGQKTRVNPNVGEATAWRGDPPSVSVGSDGAVYVVWSASLKSELSHGSNISLSVSRDDGKSFSAPVVVNDDKYPAMHGMSSLAVSKDGGVFVAWLDERFLQTPEKMAADKAKAEVKAKGEAKEEKHVHMESNREVYLAVSNDGGKSFTANKKIAADVCPCCKTALTVAQNGRVYVGWRQVLPGEFRHIAIASSDDKGVSFSAPVIVSDDQWQISACPVSGPALKVDENSALTVAWFTSGASGVSGVYEAKSTDEGKTFAPRHLIGEGVGLSTPTLLPDGTGKFGTLWGENEKISLAESSQKPQELGQGDSPVAAIVGNRIFVFNVKKENERRGVWLSVVR